ncbi:MAG: hypothetical protein JSW27_17410, partial [Phycisphaerales bacterium]
VSPRQVVRCEEKVVDIDKTGLHASGHEPMEHWYANTIEPSGLSRRDKNHGYEFYTVMYRRTASEAGPSCASVLYFPNVDRNVYGFIDYEKFATSQNIRAIAAKLIKDTRFRSQFLAAPEDDEMLTSNWK